MSNLNFAGVALGGHEHGHVHAQAIAPVAPVQVQEQQFAQAPQTYGHVWEGHA